MNNIFVFTNVIIFVLISMLHFYWAFGGNWGIRAAIPEKYLDSFFHPANKMKNSIATIIVAIGLLLFAFITFLNTNFIALPLPDSYIHYTTGIIGSIFFIRGIGDGNMFGLFKKRKESLFEKYDSLIYTPLCLLIATVTLLILLPNF